MWWYLTELCLSMLNELCIFVTKIHIPSLSFLSDVILECYQSSLHYSILNRNEGKNSNGDYSNRLKLSFPMETESLHFMGGTNTFLALFQQFALLGLKAF